MTNQTDLDTGQAISPENIRAAGVIHYSAALEEMRVFEVMDRIVEMFADGVLPIGQSMAGGAIYRYWKDGPERTSEAERRTLYSRVLGLPGGTAGATPNAEFATLWQRFVDAVAGAARQPPAVDSVRTADGLGIDQRHVRGTGRDLAVNVSVHGHGMAAAAAKLWKEINATWDVLSSAEVQQAFGTRTVMQLIDRVSRDLGGAVPGNRPRTKAQAGAVIFGWLASRASLLSHGSGDVLDPADIRDKRLSATQTTNPTDYDLVNACEQWLAVAAVNDGQIETDAEPEPSQVRAGVDGFLAGAASFRQLPPARREEIARDTAQVVEYLAERGGVADELIQAVDFPAFVAGLIHGTFNAIVDSSMQQMEAYGELIKSVASFLHDFHDALTDETAVSRLCEHIPPLGCGQASATPALVSVPSGRGVRPRVAARQQLLAAMVMMGISRVVRSGD